MTKAQPLVSVLVTVYNREPYLKQTLISILSSTFSDFEVIVVDDGSTDRSLEIAHQFAAQDDRMQVHANDSNLGDYPNRLKAASLARGRYLKYVDSDDLIYPHSLAIMVESMERFPEAALGLSHSLPEDELPYPWMLTPKQTYHKQFLGRGCLSCGPTGAIIRRDVFEELGGFRHQWGVLSDKDMWFRLAALFPTVLLPPGLTWWRRHEGQEFTKGNAELVYLTRGHELVSEALSDKNCPLFEVDRCIAISRQQQHYARRILSLALRKHQIGNAISAFKGSELTLTGLLRGFRPYR